MKTELKHLIIGMFLGSLIHFAAQELAHFVQSARYSECLETGSKDFCKKASKNPPLWERVVLFELNWLSGQDGD